MTCRETPNSSSRKEKSLSLMWEIIRAQNCVLPDKKDEEEEKRHLFSCALLNERWTVVQKGFEDDPFLLP